MMKLKILRNKSGMFEIRSHLVQTGSLTDELSVLDKKQFASLVNTKTDPEEIRKLRSENRTYVKTIKRVKKDLNSKLKMFQEILDDRLEESSPSDSPVKSSVIETCFANKVCIGGHNDDSLNDVGSRLWRDTTKNFVTIQSRKVTSRQA